MKDDSENTETLNQLKTMSPSAIDFEIRAISYDSNFEDLFLNLNFIKNELKSKQNFDIIQAYLNIFLKVHMEMIPNNEELVSLCTEIEEIQKNSVD